jgi:hypothetical protein
MSARRRSGEPDTPASLLEHLAKQALDTAKTGRRHHRALSGDNFYGNKLAELRLDAASAFEEFSEQSTGDTAAVAELIETVFAAATPKDDRLRAFRELSFSLRKTWRKASASSPAAGVEGFFPTTILAKANRGYISSIGRQMNGCYASGWRDACAVMMRRLLEIVIIEAFEKKGVATKIKNPADDNYFQLSHLVDLALVEPAFGLSRNTKKALPKLRDAGHSSAHGRYFHAAPEDLDRMQNDCRVVIEEFLHLAGLL